MLDGYASMNVNNQSGKDLKVTGIETGEVEGKITLIDNFKVDTNNVSKVTRYTRIGNDIVVEEGYGRPDNNVSSSYTTYAYNGEADRRTYYNPESGARYFWLNGEEVTQTNNWNYRKKTVGFFGWNFYNSSSFSPGNTIFASSQMSPQQLDQADWAAVESTISDDYRMSTRYERTGYQMNIHNNNKSCRSFIVTWCTITMDGNRIIDGNYYYQHDVRADRQVAIRFIGSDAGSVTINSNAGIRLEGKINNKTGTTSVTASDDIIATTSRAAITAATLTLDGTNIGDDNRSIRLLQGNNDIVNVVANGNVYLKSQEGNVNIRTFTNPGAGTVDIYAGENITFDTNSVALRGTDMTLKAQYGSITDISGNAIRIDGQGTGTFNAFSRSGNLAFTEISGDMNIGVVDAIGNVALTTLNGSIKDANSEQTDDVATQQALLDLWNELQLTGQAAENKRTAQINSFEREMTELYNDYWELRDVQETSPGSGQYVAQNYDPNFSYQANAQERAALNNDPTRIAQYEASKQTRYQQGYEKFGDPTYNPNYAHNATTIEIDNMTAGYKWEQHELEVPLPGQAFKEVTDTTAFIEDPNIIGNNITLTVTNGSIGIFGSTDNFTIEDITDNNLDNASKIKLAAAESDDVDFDNSTGILLLTPREDLDIKARFANSVVNINVPQGHAFVGGENSDYGLNINTLAARDEVRLKINGDIFNVRTDNNAALSSANAIVESGAGQIGTSTDPFRIDVASGSKITARAANGIWMEEVSGDMAIGQIYSPTIINLRSNTGNIVDFEERFDYGCQRP